MKRKLNRRNKFDLQDSIPSHVKREVRRRDGFGCVRCGNAFYQYHHFDPEFVECREHKIEGICLLCSSCHGLRSTGRFSSETVRRWTETPKCKQVGFSRGILDTGLAHPEVIVGSSRFLRAKVLLRIHGVNHFSILPPEQDGGPFRVSCSLQNKEGNLVLTIVENEIQVIIGSWDVEVVGTRLTIRHGPGDIGLTLNVEPPNKILIERLCLRFQGASVDVKSNGSLECRTENNAVFVGHEYEGFDCEVGIDLTRTDLRIGLGCSGGSIGKGKLRGPAIDVPARRNSNCPCGSGLRLKRCHGEFF